MNGGGAADFHTLATSDHVGAFGGGYWHSMFFGDLLIYTRSGAAANGGVVVYRLAYHDPGADGVLGDFRVWAASQKCRATCRRLVSASLRPSQGK